MGQSVSLNSMIDIDSIGPFDILRFGVEQFGKDPAFPDDSHGLSDAGVGILMLRIQQARRMVFSAQAGESWLRMRTAPDSQLITQAFFSVASAIDGKSDHFLASVAFQNVLIESYKVVPIPNMPAIVIVTIMADKALISYTKTPGVLHDM